MSDPSSARGVARRTVLSASLGLATAASMDMARAPHAEAAADSYFPIYGDTRYSVSHYNIGNTVITQGKGPAAIWGTTSLTCRALVSLVSFQVDLALKIYRVTVNGVDVPFSQVNWRKWRISRVNLPAGSNFVVRVWFVGHPVERMNQLYRQGVLGMNQGVMQHDNQTSWLGEPHGAIFWYASNDRLDNKARYSISVSTQAVNQIVSVGVTRVNRRPFMSGSTPYVNSQFVLNQPVHSWVVSAHVGPMQILNSSWRSPDGRVIPLQYASPWSRYGYIPEAMTTHTPKALDYFSRLYGPYPFDTAGGVAVGQTPNFWALEDIGSPAYTPSAFGIGNNGGSIHWGPSFVAHENAHMWFGNCVTSSNWRDLSLIHEGIACVLAWDYLRSQGLWSYPFIAKPGLRIVQDPGPNGLSNVELYNNAYGVMLELRRAMDGSIYREYAPNFTKFLRGLVTDYRYRSINRAIFKQRAQAATPRSLAKFWSDYRI